jgi:hypothetical protein
VQIGGHEFVSAPMADLPLLYPVASMGPRESVNAVFHSGAVAVNSRIQSVP